MANVRVERINNSDLNRTRTLATQGYDAREQVLQATHIIRILGIVGTADELAGIAKLLEAGGNEAKKLLTKKLEDLVSALSQFCSITVTQNAPASSSYSTGAEMTALAAFMGSLETGTDKNQSIYPTSATSVIDPSYN